MPWMIGIDEAGYGPNLGPLVMSAVAYQVPRRLARGNLWSVLSAAVRRHPSEDDGRILVEDSKVVYSTTRGLVDLEIGVQAALGAWRRDPGATLGHWLEWLCPASRADVNAEGWYTGASLLPLEAEPTRCANAAERFRCACAEQRIRACSAHSVLVCPRRFNGIVDGWGSKGAVLGHGLGELLQHCRQLDRANEPLLVVIDKHGGRNTYTALLQHAFPDGMVVAQEESMDRSAYRVLGIERDIRLAIEPRADANHFCVALASMVSKYLRELLMSEFNAFWQRHVPGLEPTAGYPGDSARFYEAIRPTVHQLGLHEDAVWRRK